VYRSRRTKKKKKNKTAGSVSLPAVARSERKCPLAMSAAVSATTVEATAATVESGATAAMESATGVAAGIASSGIITGVAAPITSARITSGIGSSADETAAVVAASIVSGATVVAAMAPSRVIPGAGTDKYSARKPLRTVKAVRRTRIGIIRIVAVRANRRPVHIARPWVGIALVIALIGVTLVVSDRNSCLNLRLRIGKRQHQHCQQRNVSQITHMNPPWLQSRRVSDRNPETFQKPWSCVGFLELPTGHWSLCI
jgi:hypothetical protein